MTKLYIIAAVLAGTVALSMISGGLASVEVIMLLVLLFGPWAALYVRRGRAMARREIDEARFQAAKDITQERLS